MSTQRFTSEFKEEAVRQVIERVYSVAKVAARLGVSSHRLCKWGRVTVIELFFSSLQKERIRKRVYKTRGMTRADVFDYIEVFYNRSRRHSHLGRVSRDAFER